MNRAERFSKIGCGCPKCRSKQADESRAFEAGAAVAFGIIAMGQAISEAIENRCWACGGILGHLSHCRYYDPWNCERNGHVWAHSTVCQECGASE